MELRFTASLVSVAILLCEHLTFFQDEAELVWPRSWRSRLSSWLFIFTRYSPYLFHFLHMAYGEPEFSTVNLQMWGYLTFLFRSATAQTMFLIVDFILSKRLTLFYSGTWVRVFVLPGFLIARIALMFCFVSLGYHALIKQTSRVTSESIMTIYSGGEAIIQLLMLGLMTIAYFTKLTAGRNPVMYRLRKREGVGSPIFCLVVMSIALYVQLCGDYVAQAIYPIYLSVSSSLACRLILSNHKVIRTFVQDIPSSEYRLVNSRL